MKRTASTMTPDQLRRWLDAHGYDTYTGGEALGVSRRQLMNYLSGSTPRRIPMLLTFDEWFGYWLASGHMEEYGRCRGQYVMARRGDRGPYDVGNVSVVTAEENVREAHLGRKYLGETLARMRASHL